MDLERVKRRLAALKAEGPPADADPEDLDEWGTAVPPTPVTSTNERRKPQRSRT